MANKFSASRTVERRFGVELRKVARVIGAMLNAHVDGPTIRDQKKLAEALASYSEALGPWAERVVGNLLKDVNRTNKKSWESTSARIGAQLKRTMEETAVGDVMKLIQRRQVELIKSLPIEAGLRAQKLSQEAVMGGKRADEVAAELMKSGEVTESRATLIARTEIAKANAALTQARAGYVGSVYYIWRTAEDGDVRESHAAMNGKVFRFDDPPEIPGEGRHGPGEFPNCRCFAEPIIPE